jgi:succinoglycan biosynthesis transport protein ExoP
VNWSRSRDALENSGHRFSGEPRDLLDLREVRKLLRRNSRYALAIFTGTILAAVIYLLVVPQTYTVVSVIHIDPRQQRVIKSEAVLSGIGADAAAVERQVDLIKSTAMTHAVIEQLGLTDDPEFTSPSLLGSVLKTVLPDWGNDGTEAAAERERNNVIARFQDQLGVHRRQGPTLARAGSGKFREHGRHARSCRRRIASQ